MDPIQAAAEALFDLRTDPAHPLVSDDPFSLWSDERAARAAIVAFIGAIDPDRLCTCPLTVHYKAHKVRIHASALLGELDGGPTRSQRDAADRVSRIGVEQERMED